MNSPQKILRWGLIGCGDIARKRVVPALNSLEQCTLQALTRADSSKAESFAREFDIPRWYNHWEELVADAEIDAVYIATPVSLHAQQAKAAANAGKHVLCEKPMAINSTECESMLEACKAKHVKLGIAYYRHFYPLIKRIKEIINSGEIGTPVFADIQAFEWFDRKSGEPRAWLLDKTLAGGGPMMDFGCHRIEVLQNLFGEVKHTDSRLDNINFKNREVEDTASLRMSFESGIQAVLKVSHAVYESRDTLDIYASKGSLHVPVLNEGKLHIKTENEEKTEHHPPHENVHLPLIENFTNAVLQNTTPAVDGYIGKQVNLILDKIYN